jgi:hypothetical protein
MTLVIVGFPRPAAGSSISHHVRRLSAQPSIATRQIWIRSQAWWAVAPTRRISTWTQVDANLQTKAQGGHSWVVLNETAVEAYRGIWLKVSPQLRTSGADGFSTMRRLELAADLLPRTHWNVNVAYYRDRAFGVTTTTLLMQLHLYL